MLSPELACNGWWQENRYCTLESQHFTEYWWCVLSITVYWSLSKYTPSPMAASHEIFFTHNFHRHGYLIEFLGVNTSFWGVLTACGWDGLIWYNLFWRQDERIRHRILMKWSLKEERGRDDMRKCTHAVTITSKNQFCENGMP